MAAHDRLPVPVQGPAGRGLPGPAGQRRAEPGLPGRDPERGQLGARPGGYPPAGRDHDLPAGRVLHPLDQFPAGNLQPQLHRRADRGGPAQAALHPHAGPVAALLHGAARRGAGQPPVQRRDRHAHRPDQQRQYPAPASPDHDRLGGDHGRPQLAAVAVHPGDGPGADRVGLRLRVLPAAVEHGRAGRDRRVDDRRGGSLAERARGQELRARGVRGTALQRGYRPRLPGGAQAAARAGRFRAADGFLRLRGAVLDLVVRRARGAGRPPDRRRADRLPDLRPDRGGQPGLAGRAVRLLPGGAGRDQARLPVARHAARRAGRVRRGPTAPCGRAHRVRGRGLLL